MDPAMILPFVSFITKAFFFCVILKSKNEVSHVVGVKRA